MTKHSEHKAGKLQSGMRNKKLIAILAVVIILGLGIFVNAQFLYLGALLLCPLMHYFMMKDMHKQSDGNKKKKCH